MSNIANEILNLTRRLDKLTQSLALAAAELVTERRDDADKIQSIKAELDKLDTDAVLSLENRLHSAELEIQHLRRQLSDEIAEKEQLKRKLLETRIAASKIIQDDVIVAEVVTEEPVKK